MRFRSLALFAALILGACASPDLPASSELPEISEGAQAISFLGDTLYPPEPGTTVLEDLAGAKAAYEADPTDADALVWYGRRTGYAGHFREAIKIFSEGIEKHPSDARMYRHRGHRHISIRELDRAIGDLERAAELIQGQEDEVEPDGQPNTRNTPTSTLQSNIWYHLGLARYLKQDFEGTVEAYRQALAVRSNPDGLASQSHWLYMALRRLGRDEEAEVALEPIHADLDVFENGAYLQLLLMYKGEVTPETLLGPESEAWQNSATAYGVGAYHLYNGRVDEAQEIFRRIVDAEVGWGGFGYIAAEAELASLR